MQQVLKDKKLELRMKIRAVLTLNEKFTNNVKNYPFCSAQTCYNRHKRKLGF